jgi:hypothetical protein
MRKMWILAIVILTVGLNAIADDVERVDDSRPGNMNISHAASCYAPQLAYIVNNMNIRGLPTTESDIVDIQYAGSKIRVLNSLQLGKWCWLHMEKGWIAKTGRVSEKKPVVTARSNIATATSVPETVQYINRDGIPPIYGDEMFIEAVTAAFNFLRNNKPSWFAYVSIIDDVKLEPHLCRGGLACAGWPYKVIFFSDWFTYNGYDIPYIASILIHEACHFYQWRDGRGHGYNLDPEGFEAECYGKQREAGL